MHRQLCRLHDEAKIPCPYTRIKDRVHADPLPQVEAAEVSHEGDAAVMEQPDEDMTDDPTAGCTMRSRSHACP